MPLNLIHTTLEQAFSNGTNLLNSHLTPILNTEVELLQQIQQCWGHGYLFTKQSPHSWSVSKYHYRESDCFIDYSI